MRRIIILIGLGLIASTGTAGARPLSSPALAAPANGALVQQFPAISWNAVAGAAGYEYQIAADSRFSSISLGSGSGKGTSHTKNLAAALDKQLPNGTYHWRVRAVTLKDAVGRWSKVRKVVKNWSQAPQITGGDGGAVSWPTTPLVLRWSSVPFAAKYIVSIATDPALSNVVVGTAAQPLETQGTNYALASSLAPGTYYWAITPLDADGHRGVRSRVASFTWNWPTAVGTSVSDLDPDPGVFDPIFSWDPVPGAARYEVEVNSAEGFPAGSKWCCAGTTTGTSLAPLQVLANNAYYWRVRAVDARGNAGVWNYGAPFTKAFDSLDPSIPNLTVRGIAGDALAGAPATEAPIVTWDPVPGASRYEVQLGDYEQTGHFCDWSKVNEQGHHADTATTAWTPLGVSGHGPFPEGFPAVQRDKMLTTGVAYCVRVLAHSDDDAQHAQVTSEWTYLNGYNNPAFTFAAPPTGEASTCPTTSAGAYRLPASGSSTSRTPYFTWTSVPGAGGYYVVIARDAGFTHVVDLGFTNVTAYAPRLANGAPLSDETTTYYWAVVPANRPTGEGVCSDALHNNPQSFNKSSIPPASLSPASGANVSAQPSFRWSASENARNYRLQVSQDPTFSNPIDDVTTDATGYTSSSTYPADTVVYWRVRANDWTGQGLNWSPTQSFVRRLPIPTLLPSPPTGGQGIEPLVWTPVPGAISYDLHSEEPDGTKRDFNVEAPSATVVKYFGAGIWRWQVRAEFPAGAGGKVPGGYSAPQARLLGLGAPGGARGVRSGSRLLITWNPDPEAKQYNVEVSASNGFSRRLDSHRTDGTSWAPDVDLKAKGNTGTLYWRVAAIDQGGNIGSYASGTFGAPHRRACGASKKAKKRAHKSARHKAACTRAKHRKA